MGDYDVIFKHVLPAALLLCVVIIMYWNGKCNAPKPVPKEQPQEPSVMEQPTKSVGEWFKVMFTHPSPWIN